MEIGLAGAGPATEAVRAAVGDVDAGVRRIDAEAVGTGDLAVVVGIAGHDRFDRAAERGRETGTPWLAVELGGVAGFPVVDAAVSGFAPGTGCYDCLAGRVAAAGDGTEGRVDAPDPEAVRFAGAVAGREAAALAAGRESSVLGGVIEVPHARRRFLPLPGCTCGDAPDRVPVREYAERAVDGALERAELALDPRVGVVSEVGEAASFPAPYYLARLADTSGFSDASAPGEAAGVDPDWDAAFMKALGEALERYSAAVYDASAFTEATPETLTEAVSPDEFVRPSGGDRPAPDDGPVPWVEGADLSDGSDAYLPAEFVVFPPPAERFRPAVTTGLGLGNSGVGALLSGLYEVVERDAAMLSWYSTFDPLGVAVDDDAFGTLRARAKSEDLSVSAVSLTQDVDVPAVAVAVERDEWPRLAVGSGASLSPARAARSALAEALQNWMELRAMGPDDAADAEGAIGRYAADPPGAVREFFAPGDRVPAAALGPSPVPSGAAELDAVLDRLDAADLDAYASRLTPRDVDALGFEAVRVLVPAAQPLFFGAAYFGERARSVPGEMGFEPRLDRDHHPFP